MRSTRTNERWGRKRQDPQACAEASRRNRRCGGNPPGSTCPTEAAPLLSGDPAALRQREWWFDAVFGRDDGDGSQDDPLASWAEWQRRVGTFTTLDPDPVPEADPTGCCHVGGTSPGALPPTLHMHIVGDLPACDPISFRNFIHEGKTVRIEGVRKVLDEGVLAGVVERDRAANVPYQVFAPSLGENLLKVIAITSGEAEGNRSYLLREYQGADNDHVSEWVQGGEIPSDGFLVPGAAPQPGDSYEIVDYSLVTLGSLGVSISGPRQLPEGLPSSLLFLNLHVRSTDPTTENPGGNLAAFPTSLGGFSAICSFTDCIIDASMVNPAGADSSGLMNCLCTAGIRVNTGSSMVQGLGARVNDDPERYPGGVETDHGSFLAIDTVTFLGNAPDGAFCDLLARGHVLAGPLDFWSTLHAYVGGPSGGKIIIEIASPLYGESGFVPIWGAENVGTIFLYPYSTIQIEQFVFDAPPALPSIEMGTGPGGPAVSFYGCGDLIAFAFEDASATYLPPGGASTTWANLLVPVDPTPASGFQVCSDVFPGPDGDITRIYAEMWKASAALRYTVFQFTPAP